MPLTAFIRELDARERIAGMEARVRTSLDTVVRDVHAYAEGPGGRIADGKYTPINLEAAQKHNATYL
ncbi:hypothetical protein EWM64_g8242 [Hericium alpestre]|uniref:Uncharacterized protein n=1 Tax=Hericium alpestre TaxID=135208 RepID=A0A4Y9ZPL9_9AGAM|nr:hypothetical protein EWM64_g8242 [Hericium alpestre]